jgi:hypothetical protein
MFDFSAFLPPFAFFLFSPSPKIYHFIFLLFHNIFNFSSFVFFKNPKFWKELKRTLEKRKGKVVFHFFVSASRISI